MPKSDDDFMNDAAEFVAEGPPLSAEEAREELRAAGIDPDQMARRMRERLTRLSWRAVARGNEMKAKARSRRRPRPAHMDRQALLPLVRELQSRRSTANFRNAEELSADDLWLVYCDLKSFDEVD